MKDFFPLPRMRQLKDLVEGAEVVAEAIKEGLAESTMRWLDVWAWAEGYPIHGKDRSLSVEVEEYSRTGN